MFEIWICFYRPTTTVYLNRNKYPVIYPLKLTSIIKYSSNCVKISKLLFNTLSYNIYTRVQNYRIFLHALKWEKYSLIFSIYILLLIQLIFIIGNSIMPKNKLNKIYEFWACVRIVFFIFNMILLPIKCMVTGETRKKPVVFFFYSFV